MKLAKNEYVYLTGLAVALVWDICQLAWVGDNSVLFWFSLTTLLITLAGFFGTHADIEAVRRQWMLWYVFPSALLGFGVIQGLFEAQNRILAPLGLDPIILPLEGASGDYTAAFYSHCLSLCAPAIAWVVAYLVPLIGRLARRAM